ncbi:MAG TPA: hypothetical protein VGW33_08400 [Terriglobia bacterium]|nr:hypothetical protein [Terriglobia bacterium]
MSTRAIRTVLTLAVTLAWATSMAYGQASAAAAAVASQNAASPPKEAPKAESKSEPAASKSAPSEIVVPSETTIPVELRVALNSRTAYVGQAIYCDTVYPVTVQNRIVIPAGSYIKGTVTQVVRPGRVKGRAQIGLRFDSITLPNGTTRDLRATLSGFGSTGNEKFNRNEGKVQGDSSKGKDVGTVAQTGAEGAVIGAIAGRGVKGAGIGGAAGALGGLVWVLATRGKEVVLPSGTDLEVRLSRPLTFYPDELGFPAYQPAGPVIAQPASPGPGY